MSPEVDGLAPVIFRVKTDATNAIDIPVKVNGIELVAKQGEATQKMAVAYGTKWMKERKIITGTYTKFQNYVRNNSPLVNQSACRSDKISLGSKTYTTRFQSCNKLCLAINHPYLSELIRILPSAVDLIGQDIDEISTSIVGYILTNSGYYRCGFYAFEQSKISFEMFKNTLTKLDPNGLVDSVYEEDLGSLGKVMWWYSKEIPVIVPIDLVGGSK